MSMIVGLLAVMVVGTPPTESDCAVMLGSAAALNAAARQIRNDAHDIEAAAGFMFSYEVMDATGGKSGGDDFEVAANARRHFESEIGELDKRADGYDSLADQLFKTSSNVCHDKK